jgi:hypothetical protein
MFELSRSRATEDEEFLLIEESRICRTTSAR